nr:hypothetical protein [Tanacetum cinerariifolium]
MTKSYCLLKQSEVFPVVPTTNNFFQAPHDSSIQQLLINGFDHDAALIKRRITQQKKKMVKISSSSENEPCCSKACKKNTESLNSKITELTDKLFDAKNMIYHCKLRLAQVEARLVEHKDRELKYCGKIRGYSVVPPPPAQIYSPPKKDMSWTSLLEFADDTITDYIRPAPTVESSPDDVQNRNPSVTVTEASPCTISPKPFIKFVKAVDCTEVKTNKVEAARKASVRYAEMYRRTSKIPNVRGNQRNWNNLKSQQLGNNFVMKKRHTLTVRVKMLEKELKARTSPTKVHKGNSWAKLEDAMRTKRSRGVVDYILQVKKKVLTKKLDCRCSIKFRGGLLGLRSISFKKLDCRCSIKFREGLLGIKCFKPFPLLVHFSTASEDKFPLLNSHC